MAKEQNRNATTLTVELAARIRSDIHKKGFRHGDFFMTEADLAAKYGVSHTIAREAAGRLRGLGILKSVKKKGLIVTEPDPAELLTAALPSIINSSEGLPGLSKLRYIIEIGAIELAMNNATEDQIDQLEIIAGEFEKVSREKNNDERENEIEIKFHGLILEMTGSLLVVKLNSVLARFFEVATSHGKRSVSIEEPIWQHYELVRAFRDKDLGRARTMMRLQFQNLLESEK